MDRTNSRRRATYTNIEWIGTIICYAFNECLALLLRWKLKYQRLGISNATTLSHLCFSHPLILLCRTTQFNWKKKWLICNTLVKNDQNLEIVEVHANGCHYLCGTSLKINYSFPLPYTSPFECSEYVRFFTLLEVEEADIYVLMMNECWCIIIYISIFFW